MKKLTDWLQPEALTIFLFHGVIDQAPKGIRNYTGKHVLSSEFQTTLVSLLEAGGKPFSAEGTLAALQGKASLPDRSFLITFDDGFRNNATIAAPILIKLDIPALFYVTTGFVEHNNASWIDLIEDAIDSTSHTSTQLPWEQHARSIATVQQKIDLLGQVRAILKGRSDLDPYEMARIIRERLDAGGFVPDSQLDDKLSWSEVKGLNSHRLFTVGGHTHTHRILSYLDRDELIAEVDTSVSMLSDCLREDVLHYSYPEGDRRSFSKDVSSQLQQKGVVMCPTALSGVNRPGDDLFELRRVLVG